MNPIYYELLTKIVIPFVASVLLALVPIFVHRLVAVWEKKTGMEVSDRAEQRFDEVLAKAVLYAEQKAVAAVKKGEPKPTPQAMLDNALNFVLAEVERLKLAEQAKEKLVALVEAKLAEKKAEGTLAKVA